jgi:ABC-type oligopeptide transport system substrate-binding subunit
MAPALFLMVACLAAGARADDAAAVLAREAAALEPVMKAAVVDWGAFDAHANAFQERYERAGLERRPFDPVKVKIEEFAKRRPGAAAAEQAARARLAVQLKLPVEALPADASDLTSTLHKLYTNGRINQADYQAAASAMGTLPPGARARGYGAVLTAVESPRERAFKGTTSFGAAAPPSPAPAADAARGVTVSHGIDPYFELKYKAGFQHLDNVEPDAPKGGRMVRATTYKFDTYSPFDWANAGQQHTASELRRLVFQTLLTGTGDNGTSRYGLVAERIEYPKDATWVVFHINPKAHYSNGVPVTAQDIEFSYKTQRATDRYYDLMVLKPVVGVEVLDERRIKFLIKPENERQGKETIMSLGGIYVLNKDFYTKHPLDKMNMSVVPLGSGPYVVEKGEAGKFVVYKRDPNYWGRDLPIQRGTFNFDEVRYDTYMDAATARMAFLRGDATLQYEGDMTQWAALKEKERAGANFKTDEVPYVMPPGFEGLAFNTSRPALADRRVRRALSLAFHFNWINQNMFMGSLTRSTSLFQGTPFALTKDVSPAERKLLERFRGQLAPEVFDAEPAPASAPASDLHNRENLKKAFALLTRTPLRRSGSSPSRRSSSAWASA